LGEAPWEREPRQFPRGPRTLRIEKAPKGLDYCREAGEIFPFLDAPGAGSVK